MAPRNQRGFLVAFLSVEVAEVCLSTSLEPHSHHQLLPRPCLGLLFGAVIKHLLLSVFLVLSPMPLTFVSVITRRSLSLLVKGMQWMALF